MKNDLKCLCNDNLYIDVTGFHAYEKEGMGLRKFGNILLLFQLLKRVCLSLTYELDSYSVDAGLAMSTYKLSKREENAASDIDFLEKCVKEGLTPKGLRWKLKIQGMEEETKEKVEKIRKDAEARVIDIMIKGMREKKIRTNAEREEAIERELERRKGWEAIKWVEKVDTYQQKCRKEAEERKKRKLTALQKAGKGVERWEERGGTEVRKEDEEEKVEDEEEREDEMQVVDSWESLVDEDKVKEFGGKIYRKKESVDSRMEELGELLRVFENYGLEVSRTPTDGNCFFHAIGEQLGVEHGEARLAAVKFLRENSKMNGEEWAAFVDEGDRGKRNYLRNMEKEGEWTDHVMVMATASAFKRRIKIFAQGGLTEIRPEEVDGEDLMVGFIQEEHYFGAKKNSI